MTTQIKDAKHARLLAQKLAGELKIVETSTDPEECLAAILMAQVRCRRIADWLKSKVQS